MFLVQCEKSRTNHLKPLLVVTKPYTCWFLRLADYIEHFKWRLRFQFGVAFWRVVLREVYFEGPNHVWRALKTSILKTRCHHVTGWTWNTSILTKYMPKNLSRHCQELHQGQVWVGNVKINFWKLTGLLGSPYREHFISSSLREKPKQQG